MIISFNFIIVHCTSINHLHQPPASSFTLFHHHSSSVIFVCTPIVFRTTPPCFSLRATPSSSCRRRGAYGAELGDCQDAFVWQARSLRHWAASQVARSGRQDVQGTSWHSQCFLWQAWRFARNFVTHNSLTNNFCTHNSLAHNFCHTGLGHMQLFHTTLSYTTLALTHILFIQPFHSKRALDTCNHSMFFTALSSTSSLSLAFFNPGCTPVSCLCGVIRFFTY